jgi:hypothetical protein
MQERHPHSRSVHLVDDSSRLRSPNCRRLAMLWQACGSSSNVIAVVPERAMLTVIRNERRRESRFLFGGDNHEVGFNPAFRIRMTSDFKSDWLGCGFDNHLNDCSYQWRVRGETFERNRRSCRNSVNIWSPNTCEAGGQIWRPKNVSN